MFSSILSLSHSLAYLYPVFSSLYLHHEISRPLYFRLILPYPSTPQCIYEFSTLSELSQLFCLLLFSPPSLPPILENSQSSGLTPACQVMNLRSGQSQSPGVKEDRATPTALFPDSNDPSSVGVRYGEGGRGSAIEGGGDEYRTGGRGV